MKTSALILLTFMISANNCLEDVGHIDLLIPHPTNSSSYFQCVGGNRMLMLCPMGQSYDVNLRACRDKDVAASVDPKENADNQILEEHIVCPAEKSLRWGWGTCSTYAFCLASCQNWGGPPPMNDSTGLCMKRCRDLCCQDCPSDCCGCSSYGCK